MSLSAGCHFEWGGCLPEGLFLSGSLFLPDGSLKSDLEIDLAVQESSSSGGHRAAAASMLACHPPVTLCCLPSDNPPGISPSTPLVPLKSLIAWCLGPCSLQLVWWRKPDRKQALCASAPDQVLPALPALNRDVTAENTSRAGGCPDAQ